MILGAGLPLRGRPRRPIFVAPWVRPSRCATASVRSPRATWTTRTKRCPTLVSWRHEQEGTAAELVVTAPPPLTSAAPAVPAPAALPPLHQHRARPAPRRLCVELGRSYLLGAAESGSRQCWSTRKSSRARTARSSRRWRLAGWQVVLKRPSAEPVYTAPPPVLPAPAAATASSATPPYRPHRVRLAPLRLYFALGRNERLGKPATWACQRVVQRPRGSRTRRGASPPPSCPCPSPSWMSLLALATVRAWHAAAAKRLCRYKDKKWLSLAAARLR